MTSGEIKHIVAFLKNKPVRWQMMLDGPTKPSLLVLTTPDGRFQATLCLSDAHETVSSNIYRFLAMLKDHPA